ncbi:unnamed protein product [Pieris macdunnoughi]|uniref:Uncharacterized protein n=1 Tax=Pieris macdunnoughi TaxID=345717 RepID=A0A821XLL4_9NEOP|nr:unnamed protein product [Pieris macdunnoughi]
MKRAAIDFNFFNDHKFEEYFKDDNNSDEKETGVAYKETPVIVKASTIRHEIGYGLFEFGPRGNIMEELVITTRQKDPFSKK